MHAPAEDQLSISGAIMGVYRCLNKVYATVPSPDRRVLASTEVSVLSRDKGVSRRSPVLFQRIVISDKHGRIDSIYSISYHLNSISYHFAAF